MEEGKRDATKNSDLVHSLASRTQMPQSSGTQPLTAWDHSAQGEPVFRVPGSLSEKRDRKQMPVGEAGRWPWHRSFPMSTEPWDTEDQRSFHQGLQSGSQVGGGYPNKLGPHRAGSRDIPRQGQRIGCQEGGEHPHRSEGPEK